jgi:hypothetical protein
MAVMALRIFLHNGYRQPHNRLKNESNFSRSKWSGEISFAVSGAAFAFLRLEGGNRQFL